jgi:hypothetical protein
MKSTREHYGLLQILQTILFHSAQCRRHNGKIMITEKNHKLLTSQIFLTDCTKKGLASIYIA